VVKKGTVSRGVIKHDDLNPDGVRVVVNWEAMVIGASVFVPCINTALANKELKRIVGSKGWESETQVRIEDNKLGVRLWRTL